MNLISNKKVYRNGKIVLTEKIYKDKKNKVVRVSLSLGRDAVLIIPTDSKKNFYLSKQKNPETNKLTFQFPSGGIKDGEQAIVAATREFSEELGLEGRMIFLGKIRPFLTLIDLEVSVFLCKGARKQNHRKKLPQEFYEDIRAVTFTKKRLYSMIRKGQIRDSYTLSALSLLNAYNGKNNN
jgi:ADP-ribose pyrophosphatase